MTSPRHTDAVLLYNNPNHEPENIFQLLVTSIKDYAIFMLDINGKVISWNEGARRLKGYDEAEILNKHFSVLYTLEDVKKGKPALALKKAEENGTFETTEWRVKKDGSLFWANVIITAIYKDNGKLHAYAKVTRDLTAQKKMLDENKLLNKKLEEKIKALERSELRLTAVIESSGGMVWSTDKNGKLRVFNKDFEETFKELKQKLPENNEEVHDFIVGSDNEEFAGFYKKALSGEKMVYENDVVIKGAKRHIKISLNPVYKNNEVSGLFCAAEDITAQKKAEEKLQTSNERFEIVLKATNEAIWDWNLVTGEVYCNDSYERLFGYKQIVAIHNIDQWIERIHPEDRSQVKNSIMEKITASDPKSWQAEYRFIKENGEIADVSDCGFIIFDDQNRPIRFVGAMQDITKRKKIEIEKEYLIDQLTNSYRDLQQFTYITSHNLRGPLSNLVGLLQHINYTDLTDYNKNIIEMFKSSTRQLYETINDLNQTLIIKNNNKLEICSVDVTEVFVNVCRYFADDIDKLPVIIYTDFACKEIPFNKSYLESVLTNLMSNAIKYRSPERILELFITTKREKKEYVSLIFADNGIGIDMKRNKDKIFGLYQRFHSNTDGAGFGLFITKTQITSFGGTINVESEPDKGAAFQIEFREKL